MEFINLKAQYKYLKKDIDKNIQEVIDGTHFILGDKVELFEKKLAEYIGVKHVVSCSDGTAALQLIYMAYGIKTGDAVFCPDMTFIASIEPACLLGATPVFCEIEPDSYNLSSVSLERQITKVIAEGKLNPKAVVAVDFLGNPADYDAIRKVTDKYNLILIEDAAQGIGASYHGKKCGSLGDIAATSFFPSKPLGCYGDGGAVFTNDDEVANLLRSLRVHGKGKTKYDNVYIGINSRLDNLQAAVLLPKLEVLDEEIEKRQLIAKRYVDGLSKTFKTPLIKENNVSAFAQYALQAESSEQREALQNKLENNQIPTIRYYPTPMHRLPVFEGINTYGEDYSITDKYADCSFGVPFSPYLTQEEQDKIIEVCLNFACELH